MKPVIPSPATALLKVEVAEEKQPFEFARKKEFREDKKPKKFEKLPPEQEGVMVSDHGIRFDGEGVAVLKAEAHRMIAEVWKDGEASAHYDLLPDIPVRVRVPEGHKVTVRIA